MINDAKPISFESNGRTNGLLAVPRGTCLGVLLSQAKPGFVALPKPLEDRLGYVALQLTRPPMILVLFTHLSIGWNLPCPVPSLTAFPQGYIPQFGTS